MTNSVDLITKARKAKLPCNTRFVKCDVAYFFMTGSHRALVDQSSRADEQKHKESYCEMLTFIFKSQHIMPDFVDPAEGLAWRARCGSGMGLICSGEVADCTLFFLAEEWFVRSPAVQKEFGLVGCWRFKDDVLLAFAGGPAKMFEIMDIYS